jgi:hypothetical protein
MNEYNNVIMSYILYIENLFFIPLFMWYMIFTNFIIGLIFLTLSIIIVINNVLYLLKHEKELDELSYNFKYHVKQILIWLNTRLGVKDKHG